MDRKTIDFRDTLNSMLSVYYHHKGVVIIHREVRNYRIPVDQEDLTAGFHTLLEDGYIQEVAKGYSVLPVGAITGKGRVFFEQGGYRDETSRLDKMIRWAKDNKWTAFLIFAFIILSAVVGIAFTALQLFELVMGS